MCIFPDIVLAAKRAALWGCHHQGRKVIFLCSALVELDLEHCVQGWAAENECPGLSLVSVASLDQTTTKDVDVLERVQ